MRIRLCVAAMLLAASSASLPCRHAAAQEKDAVTDMARRRFQEGVKFFDQKRYEEARAAFLQAYALKHHPAVLLNLAHSEIKSGHNLEAARHFSTYLREPPPNATGAEKAEAEKALASARSKLGRIQVSATAGAEILVDGESVGQAPLPEAVDVAPGSHTLEAKLGGRSTSTSVSVAVGRSATASLSLDGGGAAVAPVAAPPVAPPTGAPPETPESKPPTETGGAVSTDTNLQVSTAGYEPFFGWLGHNKVGWLGVAMTGVGAGLGIGFAVAGSKATENADSVAAAIQTQIADDNIQIDQENKARKMMNQPPVDRIPSAVCAPDAPAAVVTRYSKACSVLKDDVDKQNTDKNVMTAGIVIGVVGLATTITAYLASGKTSTNKAANSKNIAQAPSAMIVPVIGAHESGFQILGRF